MGILREVLSAGRSPKILPIGSAIRFADVRLRVDVGLLPIVLVSLAARKPFTLQYAREQVAKELWDRPEFIRINSVITAVWAAAFGAMVLADLLLKRKAGPTQAR